jgi:hypothetical protein
VFLVYFVVKKSALIPTSAEVTTKHTKHTKTDPTLPCHCEERSDEAIQLNQHAAKRSSQLPMDHHVAALLVMTNNFS